MTEPQQVAPALATPPWRDLKDRVLAADEGLPVRRTRKPCLDSFLVRVSRGPPRIRRKTTGEGGGSRQSRQRWRQPTVWRGTKILPLIIACVY